MSVAGIAAGSQDITIAIAMSIASITSLTLRKRRTNDKIHDNDTDSAAEAPGVHNFREARDRIHPDMDLGDRDLRVRVLKEGRMTRDDAISREAAISAIVNADNAQDEIDSIRALPSVTSGRHKGRWIDHGEEFECSVCTEIIYEMDTCLGKPQYKYCPYCGAEMESEE